MKSALEASFDEMVRFHGLDGGMVAEHRFHPHRKWRFDFAWPDRLIAVEIEGISPGGTRHQRLPGFIADCEKYEAALVLGWRVYRIPGPWVLKAGRDRKPRRVWRKETVDTLRELLRY